MEGLITNFRGGKHTKYDYHMLISVEGIDNREKAMGLIGKEVTWETPTGKKISGKVKNAHGNSGGVRVIFEKGLPGQAITKKVRIE